MARETTKQARRPAAKKPARKTTAKRASKTPRAKAPAAKAARKAQARSASQKAASAPKKPVQKVAGRTKPASPKIAPHETLSGFQTANSLGYEAYAEMSKIAVTAAFEVGRRNLELQRHFVVRSLDLGRDLRS